jgi:ATP-dependent RNA helicase RhlE
LQQHSPLGWEGLKLKRQFVKVLLEEGLDSPTLIQERCIPLILSGQKVIGIAPTGTGKTAAFLLPLLNKLSFAQGEYPRLLILAPTKELVIQITNQARLFSRYTDIRTTELYGGVGVKVQTEKLKMGTDVLVATPGRFMELYLNNSITTKLIKNLVIDEADRMMDMNFMPQLRYFRLSVKIFYSQLRFQKRWIEWQVSSSISL